MIIKPARILAINDAVRLYFIIGKYVDTKNTKQTVFEFIQSLIKQLSADEYVECICILTGTDPTDITKEDGKIALGAFVDGISKNQVFRLVSWMNQLKNG